MRHYKRAPDDAMRLSSLRHLESRGYSPNGCARGWMRMWQGHLYCSVYGSCTARWSKGRVRPLHFVPSKKVAYARALAPCTRHCACMCKRACTIAWGTVERHCWASSRVAPFVSAAELMTNGFIVVPPVRLTDLSIVPSPGACARLPSCYGLRPIVSSRGPMTLPWPEASPRRPHMPFTSSLLSG